MSGLVWLASYPKSGNTWLRIFLTTLLRGEDWDLDINNLIGGPIASSRELFDEMVGYDSADLTQAEIQRLRPEVYARMARQATGGDRPLFCKVHDANLTRDHQGPPGSFGVATLYLVRNPLEVAVSYANHSGAEDLDVIISHMADSDYTLAGASDRQPNQLRQVLGSWSGHVAGWLDGGHRLLMMRYEDMKHEPEKTFGGALDFLGLSFDPGPVKRAIDACAFERLREQERVRGFREKPMVSTAFFRGGETNSWRGILSEVQVAQIIADHGPMMRRLGYLSEWGEPIDIEKQGGRLWSRSQ